HREKFYRFSDPVTGVVVTRLTGPENNCHHPYFYCRAFSRDGRLLLYSSDRSGRPGLYVLSLETAESLFLTDEPGLDTFMATFTTDGRFLYYSVGDVLYRLELKTLKCEEVYRQSAPYNGRGIYPGYSDDFQLALLAQMHRDDVYHGQQGWDFFQPQCRLKPRCRLVLVNLSTGQEKIVLEEKCWLGHPQIRPGDPDTLMYCHEGPHYLIDTRIWLIRADGTGQRPLGYVRKTPASGSSEIVTHEYFTPDGRYIAYTHFPGTYGQQGSIRMTQIDTGKEVNLGYVHNYSHPYHSPDSRFVVGDEMKKTAPGSACLWLLEIATRQEKVLCRHGSSFAPRGRSTQDAHPHPNFSPDSRLVVFTSDLASSSTGNCSVYLVPVVT
ncbi:MAG TPA: oligogalacturonate lyase family protein, partial [bacterium]|nr:oligogalacturonate lyase family protein [bacterium]